MAIFGVAARDIVSDGRDFNYSDIHPSQRVKFSNVSHPGSTRVSIFSQFFLLFSWTKN